MKKFIPLLMLFTLFTLFSISCSKTDKLTDDATVANQSDQTSILNIERHPRAADYSMIFGKMDKLPEKGNLGYDIRSTDLTSCDLSKDYDKLLQATFDTKTVWPDKMPADFKPEEIMELYKNPGLKIRELHEKGITGKGVGIGIIDQPLLVDHIEYKDRLKYYTERDSVSTQDAAMHGAAVASIAVGKNVGVAPEANLYYIADDFLKIKDNYSLLAESINTLLDLNKSLPNENRIRVISISWGYDADGPVNDDLEKAYQRAEEEGVFVITTSLFKREDMEFFGLDKSPLSDSDDFNSYTKILYGINNKKSNISVPMNYRCTASPTGIEDYAVYGEGGKSWATPYIAGLYALACQVKPTITYKEFWELAASTAKTGKGSYEGTSYTTPYIVDPMAIIDAIENK